MGTSKSDRHLFILLEYVPGGSIAGMLAQYGSFSEDLIRRLSYQILLGIEYLHGKGIIHRLVTHHSIFYTFCNMIMGYAIIATLKDPMYW